MDLKDLLPLLKSHGVRSYKHDSKQDYTEIHYFDRAEVIPSRQEEPKLPDNMPHDLKNPELMSVDKILNWSTPGEDSVAPLEGTGDAPINGGEP